MLIIRDARHFSACSEPKHSGAGPDHGQAIAGLIGCRQRCLTLAASRLNAKSVQRNVLRCRTDSHRQRAPDDRLQGHTRVIEGHRDQPHHDAQLRQQQPAAPASKPGREQGNRHPVHQRRPDPLEGIGQTHPAQVADGGAVNACFAQPETQGAKHQQQGQTGRKTQRQHAQGGWFQINLETGKPAGLDFTELGCTCCHA